MDCKIADAVDSILHKAGMASDAPSPDSVFALAIVALASLVGPSAVHDVAEWKTKEKLEEVTKKLVDVTSAP